jgi:hypothetical protein
MNPRIDAVECDSEAGPSHPMASTTSGKSLKSLPSFLQAYGIGEDARIPRSIQAYMDWWKELDEAMEQEDKAKKQEDEANEQEDEDEAKKKEDDGEAKKQQQNTTCGMFSAQLPIGSAQWLGIPSAHGSVSLDAHLGSVPHQKQSHHPIAWANHFTKADNGSNETVHGHHEEEGI